MRLKYPTELQSSILRVRTLSSFLTQSAISNALGPKP
jgi:hypothetical protein